MSDSTPTTETPSVVDIRYATQEDLSAFKAQVAMDLQVQAQAFDAKLQTQKELLEGNMANMQTAVRRDIQQFMSKMEQSLKTVGRLAEVVDKIQTNVDTIAGTLSNYQEMIDARNEQIANLQSRATEHGRTIDTLTTAATEVKADMHRLRVSVFGDSSLASPALSLAGMVQQNSQILPPLQQQLTQLASDFAAFKKWQEDRAQKWAKRRELVFTLFKGAITNKTLWLWLLGGGLVTAGVSAGVLALIGGG